MKSEQFIHERLKAAKQELDITEMLLRSCDDCERYGFQMKKAREEAEIKTLKWVLDEPYAE